MLEPLLEKPFSEACEQNRGPILDVLAEQFSAGGRILEIGSGTGQHAVHFARQLPRVEWFASDVPAHHPGIRMWFAEAGLANLHGPLALDVNEPEWPGGFFDGVFSANTAHIMSWPSVVHMFDGIGRVLRPGGVFCLYGPFNYHGAYTSESNARFDEWLKERDPQSGIRDVDELHSLAAENGLYLKHDHEMPVNNRTLVWRREG